MAFVLGATTAFSAHSQAELAGFIYFFAATGAAGGALCAALSLRRRERGRLLAVVGLVLGLGPILYLAVALAIFRSTP